MAQRLPLIISAARWIAEFIAGDELYVPGNIRTRVGNTGGSDALVRHVWMAPAGFVYFTNPDGSRRAFIGPEDSAPVTTLAIGGGTGPGSGPTANDAIWIALATNFVNIDDLFTVTHSPGNNSLRAATTAYADAAAATRTTIADVRKIAALRAY
jgi:hypothetical protein